MKKKEKDAIALVKTDYDNFKDLSFFIKQQEKAEQMLREVEEFKKSFVLSKMMSMSDWVKENPTHGLKIFDQCYLKVRFTPNGILGYIFVSTANFHWFSPKKEEKYYGRYSIDECYMKNYPKEKRKVLNQFFDDTHRSFQDSSESILYEQIYDKSGKSELIPWNGEDEEHSLYIIKEWTKYVKPDVLEKINDEYEAYRKKLLVSEDNNKFGVIYHAPNNAICNKQVITEMEKRFSTAISYIRELYCQNPHIVLEEMMYDESDHNHFYFKTNEKNCVMWKGRPRLVSRELDNIRIKTDSDKSKIVCTFVDTANYKRFNFDSFWIDEKRTCQLTYSTKNNELIDYQVFKSQNRVVDRNRY